MAFSIVFEDEPLCYPYDDPAEPAASGLLTLGATRQGFMASLYQWSVDDYQRQWKQAIIALLRSGDKAALVTTYGSPEVATHLEWWPMYLVGQTVYFQDHFLFYDQLPRSFSMEVAFSFLCERETVNEEGRQISEWEVPLAEVEAFARTL
jgi:hypothetical protein